MEPSNWTLAFMFSWNTARTEISVSGQPKSLNMLYNSSGAKPGGGQLGDFPPRNFQNIPQKFWRMQKLSKNKDEIFVL